MRRLAILICGCCALVACAGHDDPHQHTLVVIGAEPQGPNCVYGGKVISTGLDRDSDGTLDDDEITSSEYICDGSSTTKCEEGATSVLGPVRLTEADDFAAIQDATCIDGDLMVVGSSLASMPAVPNLTTVTGSVIIAGNPALESLEWAQSIRDVGRRYIVQGNDALSDLTGLGTLQRYQTLAIIGNDALTDLAGLAPFTSLEGLQVSNNSSLVSLHGLENVTRVVRERFTITSNKNLFSVAALENLRSAPLIDIIGNVSVPSIALPNLEKIDVHLQFKDNAALTAVDLPTLLTTGGLFVRNNPALGSVNAPELVLSGAVAFEHDTTLGMIFLPKLAYTTADFDLVNLPQLTQTSTPALVAIGGRLLMNQLAKLASFAGFAQLSSVGGNFTMQACNSLADFGGFTSLVDVANMTITQNAQLVGFGGLESFAKVGGDLVITSNPNLSKMTAETFADTITVVGNVTIN